MRYLSIIFASMLLVGCAQSTDVESTQDVDIQSQEQTTEPEADTQEQQPETEEQTTEDSIEADESTEESSSETNSTESESNETNSTESGSTETSSSDAQETEQAPEPEPEPAPEPVEEVEPEPTGFTLTMVQENDDASSCWSVINGNVYDLTAWINRHPGGSSRILGLCGTDGSSSFNAMHSGQSNPESRLQSFLLGPLS